MYRTWLRYLQAFQDAICKAFGKRECPRQYRIFEDACSTSHWTPLTIAGTVLLASLVLLVLVLAGWGKFNR